MKTGTIITSLDIGTTKICAIIAATTEEGELEVLGIGTNKSEGLSNGVVNDIRKASKSISSAIEEAELMADRMARNIHVGIAGEHIKSQNTIGRISLSSGSEPCEIDGNHINDVINNAKNNVKIQQGNEKLEIIHAIPQYYDIDGQKGIRNPLNMSGFNLTAYVHVVMAEITSINNIKKCVEIAGYKVKDILLEPVASSYSVLNEVEKKLGAIIIDIGGGTTDIAVFYKNSIRFSAVISLGGTNITQDISIGLHSTPDNAEEIKKDVGNAVAHTVPKEKIVEIKGIAGREPKQKKLRYISEIIEARMREIFEDAYKILNEHHNLKLITAGLTLTGGASLLKNSEYLAEEIFNMSTKTGYPNLENLGGPTERLNNPKYATAIGVLYYVHNKMKEEDEYLRSPIIKDPFTNIIRKIKEYFKNYI